MAKKKKPTKAPVRRKPDPLPTGTRQSIDDALREIEGPVVVAVRCALDYERERIADELASIIGDWPHGLEDLEALEARCRRGEP